MCNGIGESGGNVSAYTVCRLKLIACDNGFNDAADHWSINIGWRYAANTWKNVLLKAFNFLLVGNTWRV
ncbi:MAG: hypothetical protein Q8S55_13315 [Methylococcaceae bacterium]|nr:hypothetical protein [Methylococcaceae bacterium]